MTAWFFPLNAFFMFRTIYAAARLMEFCEGPTMVDASSDQSSYWDFMLNVEAFELQG